MVVARARKKYLSIYRKGNIWISSIDFGIRSAID